MLRIEVTKNCSTAASSQFGAFETSTTTDAPSMTSASPSPVRVLTPDLGDAGTICWRCVRGFRTSFDPMSPVPPVTMIFELHLALFGWGIWSRRTSGALPTLDNRTHASLPVSALVAECRLNGVHYPLTGARTARPRSRVSVYVQGPQPYLRLQSKGRASPWRIASLKRRVDV